MNARYQERAARGDGPVPDRLHGYEELLRICGERLWPGEVRHATPWPLSARWTRPPTAWSCGTAPPAPSRTWRCRCCPSCCPPPCAQDRGGQDGVHPGGHFRRHRQGRAWRALPTCRRRRSWCSTPRTASSKVQEAQMVTQEGANVGVCAVVGNFDDAQAGVKRDFLRRGHAEPRWRTGDTSCPPPTPSTGAVFCPRSSTISPPTATWCGTGRSSWATR